MIFDIFRNKEKRKEKREKKGMFDKELVKRKFELFEFAKTIFDFTENYKLETLKKMHEEELKQYFDKLKNVDGEDSEWTLSGGKYKFENKIIEEIKLCIQNNEFCLVFDRGAGDGGSLIKLAKDFKQEINQGKLLIIGTNQLPKFSESLQQKHNPELNIHFAQESVLNSAGEKYYKVPGKEYLLCPKKVKADIIIDRNGQTMMSLDPIMSCYNFNLITKKETKLYTNFSEKNNQLGIGSRIRLNFSTSETKVAMDFYKKYFEEKFLGERIIVK